MAQHIPSGRKAFTLVELLVVIGVIALLISALMPALNKAREQAQRVQCSSNLRQVGIAFVMYANDNKGLTPPCLYNVGNNVYEEVESDGPNAFSGDVNAPPNCMQLLLPPPWGQSNQKYLNNNEVLFCPSDDIRCPYRNTLTTPQGQQVPGWGNFAIGNTSTYFAMSYWYWYLPANGYTEAGVSSPIPSNLANDRLYGKYSSQHAVMADQGYVTATILKSEQSEALEWPFFHQNGWNVLYLDGHVKWVAESMAKPIVVKDGTYGFSTTTVPPKCGIVDAWNQNYN